MGICRSVSRRRRRGRGNGSFLNTLFYLIYFSSSGLDWIEDLVY
jgi:hypothetical protein